MRTSPISARYLIPLLQALVVSCGDSGDGGGAGAGPNAGGSGGGPTEGAGTPSGGGGADPTGGTGAGGDVTGGGGTSPDCAQIPPAPVAFEVLQGFTGAEDFAFDSVGNYIAIDENSNLVRITKAGVKSLWVPNIAGTTAGIVALPDDSVVFCDVDQGALKRVFPAGNVMTLLGGLSYPNGLDVGPDGYLYVAENFGDLLRRVDPDTGASTDVVTLSLPNGVAFSDTPNLAYVGSYELGHVYRVDQPTPGQPGSVQIFAGSENFSGTAKDGYGIDGIGVDKCGNVYTAEYISGRVYRITPAGDVTLIAELPSGWVPNIHWGRGVGGFEKNVMYVADRDQGRLFGVQVVIEGVTEFADL